VVVDLILEVLGVYQVVMVVFDVVVGGRVEKSSLRRGCLVRIDCSADFDYVQTWV
jgi:hypothetical protein